MTHHRSSIQKGRLLIFALLMTLALSATSARAARSHLDERIGVDYDRTPLGLALKVLFLQTDLSYRIASAKPEFEERRVDLCLRGVRVRVVLDALCDSVGCTWHEKNGEVVFAPVDREGPEGEVERNSAALERLLDENSFDWDIPSMTIGTAARLFEQTLGVEIVVPSSLSERKLGRLAKQTVRRALDQLCAEAGCTWRVGEGESGLSVLIEVASTPPS